MESVTWSETVVLQINPRMSFHEQAILTLAQPQKFIITKNRIYFNKRKPFLCKDMLPPTSGYFCVSNDLKNDLNGT